MFTRNFYKVLAGKATNATYNDIGLIRPDGSVYSSASNIVTTFRMIENFAYPGSESSLYLGRFFTTAIASATGYGGVFFGDGSTTPTIDDVDLSGDVITTLSGTASLSYKIIDNYSETTAVWTLTNTGNKDVTISEVALACGGSNHTFMLFERTVLDSPVTIAAGGVGQVTYTLRLNYPTT